MKKTITIRIPEPCHEDWNKMTSTEKGKFCGVCEKEVFDFTKATDEELVKKVYNNEKLCGRFKNSQINREMKLERKSGLSLAPLAASFLLPFTLLASTKTSSNSKLQGKFVSLNVSSLDRIPSDKVQIITQGRITDEDGKAIFNVEIKVKDSDKSELSGINGEFKIVSVNDETIQFIKDGFIIQETILNRQNSTIEIILEKKRVSVEKQLVRKVAVCQPSYSKKKLDSISDKKQEPNKILIKGFVSDDNDFPLPGVNIVVKESTNGTQTDFDGNYELEVDKNQVLVFSYVGFRTEEITLSNIDNNFDLKMNEDATILGEYFITGIIVVKDDSSRLMGFNNYSTYDPEPSEWRKSVQTSLDNEKEYSKIKRNRKKEARKLKRNKK